MQGLQLRMGAVFVAVAVLLAVAFFSPASCHLQEVQHTKAGATRENVEGNTNEEEKIRRQQKLENNGQQEEAKSGNRSNGVPRKEKGELVMEEGRSQMIRANAYSPPSSLVPPELNLPSGDNNNPMHIMGNVSPVSLIPPALLATIPLAYSETPITAPASDEDVSAAFDSPFSTSSPTFPATTNPLHAAAAAIGAAAAAAPFALDALVRAPFAHDSSVLVLPPFSTDEDAATSITANATADGVGASLPSLGRTLGLYPLDGYSTVMERVLQGMAEATAPTPSHEKERLRTTGGGGGGESAGASAATNSLRVPVAEQIRAAAKLGDLSPFSAAEDGKADIFPLGPTKGRGRSTISEVVRDVAAWLYSIIPDFGFSQEEREITRAERKILRRLGRDEHTPAKEQ